MQFRGTYLFYKNELTYCNEFDYSRIREALSVYEVIRLIDGVPLFLERHVQRMEESARLNGHHLNPDLFEIACQIRKLSDLNRFIRGNIRLTIVLEKQGHSPGKHALLIVFVPHRYPSDNEYKTGVKLGSLKAERPNPQAKTSNHTLRSLADKVIEQKKVYEVLLVNKQNEVTEGSRSNVFFILDDQVFTPPAEDVLSGITRQIVFEICKNQGVPVQEKEIFLADVHKFQSAFITGTSPKVLPVTGIDDVVFKSIHPQTRRIMEAYDEMIEKYVQDFDYGCFAP